MTLEDENWKVLVEHNIEMAKHWKKKYEEAQDYLSGRELWKQRAVSAEKEVDELRLENEKLKKTLREIKNLPSDDDYQDRMRWLAVTILKEMGE